MIYTGATVFNHNISVRGFDVDGNEVTATAIDDEKMIAISLEINASGNPRKRNVNGKIMFPVEFVKLSRVDVKHI